MSYVIPKNVWQKLRDEEGYGVRGSYSGRGMFGETCAGFVTSNEFALGVDLGRLLGEDADKLTRKTRTDSMGRSDTIVYFPGVSLEGWTPKEKESVDDPDEEEEDEDEE